MEVSALHGAWAEEDVARVPDDEEGGEEEPETDQPPWLVGGRGGSSGHDGRRSRVGEGKVTQRRIRRMRFNKGKIES